MSKKRRLVSYKLIYVIIDMLIAFVITLIAFLSFYKPSGFAENSNWIYSLIFLGGVAFLTPIVFSVAKIYKIITVQFSIVETGLCPGENLYEEILLDITNQIKTENELIYIEPKKDINTNLENDVLSASKVFGMDEEPRDVKDLLKILIKTYHEKPEKDDSK